jgi:hypothetical protein
MSLTFKVISQLIFVSVLFSVTIKYAAPRLIIPTSNTTATIGVFLPVLAIALILWWRQGNSASY